MITFPFIQIGDASHQHSEHKSHGLQPASSVKPVINQGWILKITTRRGFKGFWFLAADLLYMVGWHTDGKRTTFEFFDEIT